MPAARCGRLQKLLSVRCEVIAFDRVRVPPKSPRQTRNADSYFADRRREELACYVRSSFKSEFRYETKEKKNNPSAGDSENGRKFFFHPANVQVNI